ncbi:unnamed protein product [Mytilus coruscus]|uniref:DDE Tnp4 domain-containing protein n=1 Tax=Mytilus coruscus TaxID=42192 RepID=A0A6J8CCI6_MYTCO|nr:unnamed protein product [Mytilus coruscus]
MVVVTTDGYFLTICGPYFADAKNNDASILKHMLKSNIEEIKVWVEKDDVFVIDRGFRDSIEALEELGIQAEMPHFMKKGEKQMTTEDANDCRLVTKIRWVVESANARIKQWRYLDNVLPTNQVSHIGEYVCIVCAISNKFSPPLSTGNSLEDEQLTCKMVYLSKQINELKQYVEINNLERGTAKWTNAD